MVTINMNILFKFKNDATVKIKSCDTAINYEYKLWYYFKNYLIGICKLYKLWNSQ